MARYRTIDIRIWMDAKFMGLDEGSQLLFIYLLTCQHVNQLGTIPMSEAVLAAYLNKPVETVSKRLRNLSDTGLIRIDNGNLIWICNFLKYNAPANPNCAKGLLAFFDEIPDCPLVDDVAESVVKACELKGSDYLKAVLPSLQKYLDRKKKRNGSETVPEPYRNQEQEQEQEQDIYKSFPDGKDSSTPAAPTIALTGENENTSKPAPRKPAPVPFERIKALYNEKLARHLGFCKILTDARKSTIRQRWQDIADAVGSTDTVDVLEGFGAFYDKVARCDFLCGRVKPGKDRERPWKANFDWIHQSSHYTAIYEGRYENGR